MATSRAAWRRSMFGDRQRARCSGSPSITGDGESFEQVIAGGRGARSTRLPRVFERHPASRRRRGAFDRIKQSAIYRLYAALEDGGDRDSGSPPRCRGGRDPYDAARRASSRACASSSADGGRAIRARAPRRRPRNDRDAQAQHVKKRGDPISLAAPIHDLGHAATRPIRRRRIARAGRPRRSACARARCRTGCASCCCRSPACRRSTSRLVFRRRHRRRAAGERGVAMVAAHTLTWDPRYLNDLFLFVGAGGMQHADVGTDRTTFSAQGVDMHLDVLLAGLRRWVREGTYDDSADVVVDAARRAEAPRRSTARSPTRGAPRCFGAGASVRARRARAPRRTRGHAATTPRAFRAGALHARQRDARDRRPLRCRARRSVDRLPVRRLAGPRRRAIGPARDAAARVDRDDRRYRAGPAAHRAPGDRRLARSTLVAAEMLGEIADDVRHQLGASYALTRDSRRPRSPATTSSPAGSTRRARRAVKLLRDRIAAAPQRSRCRRARVRDRAPHVLTQLVRSPAARRPRRSVSSTTSRSGATAVRSETAAAVRTLTIDAMAGDARRARPRRAPPC